MSFTAASLAWLGDVLEERFGHGLSIRLDSELNRLELSLPGQDSFIVFDNLLTVFHASDSDFPCGHWDAKNEGFVPMLGSPLPLPGLGSLESVLVESFEKGLLVHYDILGLTYWMLTRLEEVGRSDLDSFQRFPAASSHAYRNGYLERPIVDEWLDILGQIMKRLWTGFSLQEHHFSVRVSHDVDAPSRYAFRSTGGLARAMIGDIIRRKNPRDALMAPFIRWSSTGKLHSADPYNTFDWIMNQSEHQGLTSAFYFICGRTDPAKDADYNPEHPAIRKLMRRIHERGHEIGLHPSFNTYTNPLAIREEANRLRSILDQEGINQESIGSRMHYLRWKTPVTPLALSQAGINHDNTLGYADHPGFRCGTSHDYPMFDPVEGQMIPLRIRPLVVMEGTVMDGVYMGLGISRKAYEKFLSLGETCRIAKGCFSLLWHNNHLVKSTEKSLYRNVLKTTSS